MAFMMPVVKNDYNIYPSSRSVSGSPRSRDSILSVSGSGSPRSRDSILSMSGSPSAVSSSVSSPRHSQTPAHHRMPKSESQNSLHRFHSKLLDKLRKTFRGKDGSSDDINQASTSITIR